MKNIAISNAYDSYSAIIGVFLEFVSQFDDNDCLYVNNGIRCSRFVVKHFVESDM